MAHILTTLELLGKGLLAVGYDQRQIDWVGMKKQDLPAQGRLVMSQTGNDQLCPVTSLDIFIFFEQLALLPPFSCVLP